MDKEKEIIKQALTIENEGYEFYSMAAQQANSDAGKEAFEYLAEEEKQHIDWLKDLYNKLQENESEGFDLSQVSSPEESRLFNWENIPREDGATALSVFGIGIKMEKEAIDFYEQAAEETNLDTAKELYETLINWEYNHFKQFKDEYDQLREDWWAEQRFAPF